MLKLFKSEMILIGCQYFVSLKFVLCCYGYSYELFSIHLRCTHTRGSDPCLSMIDPQSPVDLSSVTALYRVQYGSFNHALACLKRWLGCGMHVV